jgi:pyruvate/2-oxoglutarate dehydrogenase complex dihydrolipoamide dehydrogenase (E3) component
MESYDLVVIGGGSAGYSAATTGARLGLRTVCLEGGREVGGLCILRGCMPSKSLIESANRFLTLRRAGEFGLQAGNLGFDAAGIIKRKQRLIQAFAGYRQAQLKTGKFDFARGIAEFVSSDQLVVRSLNSDRSERLGFKSVVIATGSELNLIDIPGLAETGFTWSDRALDSDQIPGSIIILGGGAIALEFAHFYSALGTKVTLLQRSAQVAKEADRDVANALAEAFRARGMEVICGTRLIRVEARDGRKRVSYETADGQDTAEAEEIFYALGRRACTGKLNLAAGGIEVDSSGAVEVDSQMQTSNDRVFAAGDVTGCYEVVHTAIDQGAIAGRNARHLISGEPLEKIDYRLKLFAIFSEPQLATIGLTEKEARGLGRRFRAASYPFDDHGKSLVRGETEGFVKLICDYDTGEIIGGAAVGPEASELIHEIVVAMHFHATAADLASIPHYHPTLSEIWTYPAEELS